MTSSEKTRKAQLMLEEWHDMIFTEYHRDPTRVDLKAFMELLRAEDIFEDEEDFNDFRRSATMMWGIYTT